MAWLRETWRTPGGVILLCFLLFVVDDIVVMRIDDFTQWALFDWMKRALVIGLIFAFPAVRILAFRKEDDRIYLVPAVVFTTVILWAQTIIYFKFHNNIYRYFEAYSLFSVPTAPDINLAFADLTLGLLLVAVSEEYVFRKLMAGYLADRYGWLVAIVVSSVAFAAIHWSQGPAGLIVAGIHGVLYAALFCLTGRIWPSIACHYLLDFLVYFEKYAADLDMAAPLAP